MSSYNITLYESDTTTIDIYADCTLKQAVKMFTGMAQNLLQYGASKDLLTAAVQEAENICKQTGGEYTEPNSKAL